MNESVEFWSKKTTQILTNNQTNAMSPRFLSGYSVSKIKSATSGTAEVSYWANFVATRAFIVLKEDLFVY